MWMAESTVEVAMAGSVYSKDIARVPDEAHTITTHLFHANIVANKNTLTPGGPFDETLTQLGVTGLRYPGGTVTEQYFDPNSALWDQLFGPSDTQYVMGPDGQYFMGPAPVIDYVNANDLDLTLVLPTSTLVRTTSTGKEVIDEQALTSVLTMVEDMIHGKYGQVSMDRIEIGNEYQAYPDMSAETYGLVANELALGIIEIFEDYERSGDAPPGWQPPDIGLQMGPAWEKGDAEIINAALDPAAAAGLTGDIIIHYYPQNLDGVNDKTALFEQHNIWDDGHDHHHGFVISEWNIAPGVASDTGMAQASSLISAFDQMVREGVDEAEIWGVQFRYSQNALSTISETDIPYQDQSDIVTRLTATGEIFASLAESTPGLMSFDPNLGVLLDNNGFTESIGPKNDQADIIVNSFGNEDSAVLYFSSRSDTPVKLSMNLDAYFGTVSHVWGEVLTTVDNPATPGLNEGDPLTPNGIPEYQTLSAEDFANGKVITLDPYEILRVNVQLDWQGVTMRGHDGHETDPIDMDDTLIGSTAGDSIHGFGGDDYLLGAGGNDVIHGGTSDDNLQGSTGNDTLRGGANADHLSGGSGADVLSGGDGTDYLIGGTGDDVLVGGADNDHFLAKRAATSCAEAAGATPSPAERAGTTSSSTRPRIR
jgi:hypothetical protein